MSNSLYDNLIALCDLDRGFYYVDHLYAADGCTYRIFNYRLATWQDFHTLPGAMECRGIMFRIDGDTAQLVSRPMQKFFNAAEGAVDHDYNNPISIMEKIDGSLISTFVDARGELGLKSKGSLSSEHVAISWQYLNANIELAAWLTAITRKGFTVNMEYVSPEHRIVIGYDQPRLYVLNVRHTIDGSYLRFEDYPYKDVVKQYLVPVVSGVDPVAFVNAIPSMLDNVEGYVVHKANGEMVKIKTDAYVAKHKCKDNINNPHALYDAVVDATSDDIRAMFSNDPAALTVIDRMEDFVVSEDSAIFKRVHDVWNNSKHLNRCEYAINARSILVPDEFSLAMSMYLLTYDDEAQKKVLKKRYPLYRDTIKNVCYRDYYWNKEKDQ